MAINREVRKRRLPRISGVDISARDIKSILYLTGTARDDIPTPIPHSVRPTSKCHTAVAYAINSQPAIEGIEDKIKVERRPS
ncbi:hypothetical protein TrispH2_007927 [Trichoplax sp. H2]|nr:hypothetical protein TrispH2_007927 [Trichoplax sp. H2]|eukprot:RDD39539.1 hypothetical protein TrispH2_007927 [Trichoplax sp. H2]